MLASIESLLLAQFCYIDYDGEQIGEYVSRAFFLREEKLNSKRSHSYLYMYCSLWRKKASNSYV